MMPHPDPGLSAAVSGLRVRVKCRPDHSQSNDGRAGRILRACTNPGSYEVRFDEPDERGYNWDYVHELDLRVTEMNGKKLTGDGLDIPTFLLRKRATATPDERRAAERVMEAAKRGAGLGVPAPSTPEARARARHPDTPGGNRAMQAELKFGARLPREIDEATVALLETQHAERAQRRSAEGRERGETRRAERGPKVGLKEFAEALSAGRPARVRKRDIKKWCADAGYALPRRLDAEAQTRARAIVVQALEQARPGVGGKVPVAKPAPAPASAAPSSTGGKGAPATPPRPAPASASPKASGERAPGAPRASRGSLPPAGAPAAAPAPARPPRSRGGAGRGKK